MNNGVMSSHPSLPTATAAIFKRVSELGLTQKQLADALGIEENKISKVKTGARRLQADELVKAQNWLNQMEAERHRPTADLPDQGGQAEYLPVEVLPTFAGMGGGGNGDGDRETALVSRSLIEHELRGKASDFLLINVRGDSMEPDFRHGDQLLVDKRDKSPAQPGPFAVWDGEWGEYVVKNVERVGDGRVRMFSSNAKYSAVEVQHEETRIVGRPVWFGRRL